MTKFHRYLENAARELARAHGAECELIGKTRGHAKLVFTCGCHRRIYGIASTPRRPEQATANSLRQIARLLDELTA